MKKQIFCGAVFCLLTCVCVYAGEKTFKIDPVHSSLTFRIRHLYTTFTGRFNSFSGTISGDSDNPAGLKVSAKVNVLSIDTANKGRDKHLRNPDFFSTKLFPSAGFESTGVTLDGDKTGLVQGKLTIRDVTRDVTFRAEFLGYGPDHKKGKRVGFHAVTTIDRRDFGINYNGKLPNGTTILGNEVELVIEIEAVEVEGTQETVTDKTLAQRINEFKAGHSKPRSREVEEALAKARLEIAAKGGIEGLKVGDKAPSFLLPDANGKNVSLSAVLKEGPVVVVFYRGEWCPFCNLQLRALEEVYPEIRKLGGELIGIAPQKPEKSLIQSEKNRLSFPLLTDSTGATMRAYRLLYQVPGPMRDVYLKRYGIDLEEYNGEGRWELPVTATFVIGKDGIVKAGLVDMDYTKRMEPGDIVSALRRLKE